MPTLILFLFIFAMAALAYCMVYPVVAQGNLTRLAMADLALMAIVLGVVGAHHYGSAMRFDFYLFEADWFLASLICLCLAEALLLPAYCRRFNIFK